MGTKFMSLDDFVKALVDGEVSLDEATPTNDFAEWALNQLRSREDWEDASKNIKAKLCDCPPGTKIIFKR